MSLKFAFCGSGYIANIHATALQQFKEEVEIIAVVDPFPDLREKFAKKFNIPKQLSNLEALLGEGDVDALIICTPNYLHVPQSLAALNAGVHVMVEKPMAMNADEAYDLLLHGKTSASHLMVAHCWRFDEEVQWLKSQIEKGLLGKIIRTKSYGVHVNWGPSGWFQQKKFAGGGALVDMGIHAIDTTRFLVGDPLPISVYARLGTYYGMFDVDDTGILIVNWDNGVSSYIETGWWQPHMDGPESSTQVYGTTGFGTVFPTCLELPDPISQRITRIDPGYKHPREEHCSMKMYITQMRYFINCIRQGKTPIPGAKEGWINMRILDCAYQSATTGQVVNLEWRDI